MNYWIVKAEPGDWSIERHAVKKEEAWTGVRNYEARNNMRKMSVGDTVLFYRSVTDPAFVGILSVAGLAYPDPTDSTGKFDAINLRFVSAFERPVSLAEVKGTSTLSNMMMLRRGRLSVVPLTKSEFNTLTSLSMASVAAIAGA